MLARHAPTIVARDRAAGAAFARSAGASVIVMDDGLQNPSLQKDFAIAIVDGRRGFGNAHVFPAGPLRAPLAAQFAKAHALLVVGKGIGASSVVDFARRYGRPVLRARLEPAPEALKALGRRKALAFAGIGDPEKFFMTLASAGIEAKMRKALPTTIPIRRTEAARILARCEAERLVPVTTEKDVARLTGQDGARGRLAAAAKAVPVTLVPDDPETLHKWLREALAAARS